MKEKFSKLILTLSDLFGSIWSIVFSLLILLIWAISGFFLHFSQNWQTSISTIASVITVVIVFIIQASETRHTKALHLKLNEIIRVLEGARNDLVGAENLTEDKIIELQSEFTQLSAEEAKKQESKKP